MTEAKTIAPLTKVALVLDAKNTQTRPPTSVEQIDFTFVCGLGIEGLSEFEVALFGKAPGDRIIFPVGQVLPATQLEHLLEPLMTAVGTHPPFDLHIEVKSVVPVTERELVKALSQKTENSDCSCSGGCGCGG